jgi:hypothetical protein
MSPRLDATARLAHGDLMTLNSRICRIIIIS